MKDITKANDKPFYVSDQLTAKKEAERRCNREIIRKNNNMKTTAAKLAILFEKRKLRIEGKEYSTLI